MIKQGAIQLLLLFTTFHCFAQQQYSLDECYRLALDRNISLKQAENNIKGNTIDHKMTQFRLLPSVSYNLGHYFSFGKNIDPVTNVFVYESFSGGYTAVGLQMQLFSGFSRLNAIKQSAYIIKASAYAKKRAELELLTNITLTYARLLLDKEQLLTARNNIESTAKELEIINEKIKVGRLTKYEYYAFNARLNTEQANLVTLQNDSLAALQDIKQLLNISFKEKMDIAPIDTSVLSNIFAAKISAEDYIEPILQKHPAIKQAQSDEKVARFGEKIARGSYYPSLSVGGNLNSNYNANRTTQNGQKIPIDRQLNDNLGQNININLRIPIFSQMENANRVKREKINISNAELAMQEAENTVVTSTLQLVNDFNASKQKYMATSTAWEQNKLSYNLYEEKYRIGQISSVELLAARDILNTSTSGYLQARLQLYFQYQVIELLKRY